MTVDGENVVVSGVPEVPATPQVLPVVIGEDPAAQPFQNGDVVEVNSGSPEMTIGSLVFDPATQRWVAECIWFAVNNKGEFTDELRGLKIPASALRLVEMEES